MKNKIVKLIVCMLIGTSTLLSCSNNNNEKHNQEIKGFLINEGQATKIVENYLTYLSLNDFENAKKLCSAKLASNTEVSTIPEMEISDFSISEVNQAGQSVIIKAKINRIKRGAPKNDLDSCTFVIDKKDDDKYEISKIDATTLAEAFEDKKVLRSRGKEEAKSKVIIKLTDIPRDMYIKDNSAQIVKRKIPMEDFGPISFSMSGEKVGITTTDGDNAFVALLEVEQVIPTVGSAGKGGKGGDEEDVKKEDESDKKPIAKKIKALDILTNSSVELLRFAEDEGFVAVQYKLNGKVTRVKVYNISSGEVVQGELDKLFPQEKYEIIISKFSKKEMFFEVKGISGAKDVRQDVIGQYKIDLEGAVVSKM